MQSEITKLIDTGKSQLTESERDCGNYIEELTHEK